MSALSRSSLEIRWDSRGAPPTALVVTLQVVDQATALIESWVEGDQPSRIPLMSRQAVPCTVTHDGDLVHFDVRLKGRRVVSISLPQSGDGLHYVHCDLGVDTGLGRGGAYDPPTVRRLVTEPDAVTA
jgi:hypothetical protein